MPLDQNGLKQARELAQTMKGLEIDEFLCSPLLRTRQTADAISEVIGIGYTIDDRLIEQDFGEFEGVNRFDEDYQAAKRKFFVRFPGGESYFDMASRVYPLIKEKEGKNVLLVTHGGICRIIRSFFADMGNEEFVRFAQGNCELRMYP
jgi:probable phosphoglycerate mutase